MLAWAALSPHGTTPASLAQPYRLKLFRDSRAPPLVVAQPIRDLVLVPRRRLEVGKREVVVDAAMYDEHLVASEQVSK